VQQSIDALRLCIPVVLGVIGLTTFAWTQTRAAPAAVRVNASIQELMDGQIDPAADALWDSVAYIASTSGVEDRQPRTDAEWRAVRAQAVKLLEGTDLLAMPGRRVAVQPKKVGEGELTPAEIQRRIGATRAAFVQLAGALRQTGLEALAAIDARDAPGLMAAGSQIDEACEACHVAYWYPNQSRPGAQR